MIFSDQKAGHKSSKINKNEPHEQLISMSLCGEAFELSMPVYKCKKPGFLSARSTEESILSLFNPALTFIANFRDSGLANQDLGRAGTTPFWLWCIF